MAPPQNPNPENGPQMKQIGQYRDWAELDQDILLVIFRMVGTIGLLKSRAVCCSWRKVTKGDHELWRRIDMTKHNYRRKLDKVRQPARLAIDRSGGTLEEFWIQGFGDSGLLQYLCDRTSSLLKSLQLIGCRKVYDEVILETVKRQPLLEELEITLGMYTGNFLELVGKELPHLKQLKLNDIFFQYKQVNSEAFWISMTMHELRHLQLIGNRLSNKGLKAILEGCPHLETLDIRKCNNVSMDSDMRAWCSRLRTLWLPNDSLDDYRW